jgi:hypothetical protein
MKIFVGPYSLTMAGKGGLLYHQETTIQVGEGGGIGVLGSLTSLKHSEVTISPLVFPMSHQKLPFALLGIPFSQVRYPPRSPLDPPRDPSFT